MINPKVLNRRIKFSGIRPEGDLTVTKSLGIPRRIKVRHNVFQSLGGRRTGRIAEAVEVDAVGDASGCLEEGVHEVLEGVLLSVRHVESCQLVFLSLLAVHSDQSQGDIGTTAGGRFIPLLHSTWNQI